MAEPSIIDKSYALIQEREAQKQKLGELIDAFAEDMKARIFQKVDEGYTGWELDDWDPAAKLLERARALRFSSLGHDDHQRRCVDAANYALFSHAQQARRFKSGR